MLTGLKVSSLAFKCGYYRLDNDAKGGAMEFNFGSL